MSNADQPPAIRPEDIVRRTASRRSFLGRFGVAAALVGATSLTAACGGGESEPADADAAVEAEAPAEASDTPSGMDTDATETTAPDSTVAPDSAADEASDADAG